MICERPRIQTILTFQPRLMSPLRPPLTARPALAALVAFPQSEKECFFRTNFIIIPKLWSWPEIKIIANWKYSIKGFLLRADWLSLTLHKSKTWVFDQGSITNDNYIFLNTFTKEYYFQINNTKGPNTPQTSRPSQDRHSWPAPELRGVAGVTEELEEKIKWDHPCCGSNANSV